MVVHEATLDGEDTTIESELDIHPLRVRTASEARLVPNWA
jgi:hypothetical protein